MAKKPPVHRSPQYTRERGREATLAVRRGELKYRIWKKLFPSSKASKQSAATLVNRLITWYRTHHANDFNEMMKANELGIDVYLEDLKKLTRATTMREVTRVEWIEYPSRNGNGNGKPKMLKRPVMLRETVEVEDNTTRMQATKEHGEILGMHATKEGPKIQVVILNAPRMEKPQGAGE